MNNRLIESVYRRLLAESSAPDTSGLGAVIKDTSSGTKVAVIFKTSAASIEKMKKIISDERSNSATWVVKAGEHLLLNKEDPVVVGTIEIQVAESPCWDGWEVKRSAGPGYGRVLYGLGYAMSPSGRLFPDRFSLSSSAKKVWARAAKERKALPMDDEHKPKTPSEEDDCSVYGGEAAIDSVYESQGWERGMLKQLVTSGEAAIKFASMGVKSSGSAAPERVLRYVLEKMTHEMFGIHYDTSAP